MALQLYFVRHGQTEFSRANRFCGTIDPPLSDFGMRMAEAIGAAYGNAGWTAIYRSPRLRALQTIAPLAKHAGLEPVVEDGLAEIAYGNWEGLTKEEARAQDPEGYAWYAVDTTSRAAPGGGETAFQVAARAMPVLERIKARHTEGRVLVVSHKATIRIMICALLGMDVRQFRDKIAQPVGAFTRFELGKSGPQLVMHADVSHLPPELREAEGT